jgi:hypothetical protein
MVVEAEWMGMSAQTAVDIFGIIRLHEAVVAGLRGLLQQAVSRAGLS